MKSFDFGAPKPARRTSRGRGTLARVATAALLSAALAAPAVAQFPSTAPPLAKPRPFSIPKRKVITLANGMKISLVPFGTTPKATVRLVLRTGSIDEAPDQLSLAALTADLWNEGTVNKDARTIVQQMSGMGGALGVGAGADLTFINADVLSGSAAELVTLVGEVARQPRFPESELARLKTARLRNLAIARTQPGTQASQKFNSIMYGDHPYGRGFPTDDQLKGYTVDQIKAFYAANVGAARAHLYVVGVFDAAAVEKAARAAFTDWAAGPAPTVKVPVMPKERTVAVIDRPAAVQSTLYVGLPVVEEAHPDFMKLTVTDALLGGSFGSRITANIRENKGYTYSPFSFVSTRRGTGVWAEQADVTTNVTGPSISEIFKEVEKLRAEAPPKEELERIQRGLAGTFVLQNGSRAGIAAQFSNVDAYNLGEDHLATYVTRIFGVTPDDVKKTMQQYLSPEKMSVVVVGDRKVIDEQLKQVLGTVP
ncbi:MAG: insulinase family protein [Gemmatimonadetes bacterium]|nr:insulinase family protein [Gemmatimonadota bacterium]